MDFPRFLFIFIALSISGASSSFAEGEGQSAALAIHDDGRYFRAPVRCFGKTLLFIVDTGTSMTVFSSDHLEELGQAVRTRPASSPSAKLTDVSIYKAPELALGALRVWIPEVMSMDLQSVAELTGEKCDGILGMDVLKDLSMTLDLDDSVLFFSKSAPEGFKKDGVSIPMARTKTHHFSVAALVNGTIAVDLMLDTSDSRAFSLNPKDWASVFPAGTSVKMARTQLGTVSGKAQETSLARVDSLKIGARSLRGQIAALSPNPDTPSTLGIGFFRRFIVNFDFPNQTLYLKPGDHLDDEDNVNMAGLHILRSNYDTIVQSVDLGSPADIVGVKKGDKLLKIGGSVAAEMKMEKIRTLLKAGDGKEVSISLQHEDQIRQVTLRLKKEI